MNDAWPTQSMGSGPNDLPSRKYVAELLADRTALMDAAVTYMATIDRLRAALERARCDHEHHDPNPDSWVGSMLDCREWDCDEPCYRCAALKAEN